MHIGVYACVFLFLTINEYVAGFGPGWVLDSYISDCAGVRLCADLCALVLASDICFIYRVCVCACHACLFMEDLKVRVPQNEKPLKVRLDHRERASEQEVMMVAMVPASVVAYQS